MLMFSYSCQFLNAYWYITQPGMLTTSRSIDSCRVHPAVHEFEWRGLRRSGFAGSCCLRHCHTSLSAETACVVGRTRAPFGCLCCLRHRVFHSKKRPRWTQKPCISLYMLAHGNLIMITSYNKRCTFFSEAPRLRRSTLIVSNIY